MSNTTVQLRVTLPTELQAYLQTKANKFGLNMSAYVKHLIINDVKDIQHPVYQASKEVEQAFQEAKEAEKQNELIEANDLDEFFRSL